MLQRQLLAITVIAGALLVACSADGDSGTESTGSTGATSVATDSTAVTTSSAEVTDTDVATTEPSTTAPPTTLDIVTVPTTAVTGATDPDAPTGNILMIKLYVGDLADAEEFYGAVFGATLAMQVGERAHIVTFPGGGPGLVLIQSGTGDTDKHGAFIIRVPDMEAAKARALDHGATEEGTFAGQPTSEVAKSVDVLDPWGNQVEILQIG